MRPFTLIMVCLLALASHRAEGEIMYSVDPPSLDTALFVGRESSERSTQSVSTTMDRTITREKFDISTSGWAYDPELVDFVLGLRPEFEQVSDHSSSGYTDEWNGTFLGFLVDANLLPYNPYSFNLYATQDRKDSTLSRAVGDSTTEYSLYRASMRAKNKVLPTTVTLESQDRTYETFLTTRTEQIDRLSVRSRHTTSASRTMMETEILERSIASGDVESTSDRLALQLDNQLQFDDRSRAVSRFDFIDQSATASSSTITDLSSHVTLAHRENLETRYALEYDDRKFQDFDSTRTYALAGLRHQLYENLTTTLEAEADKREGTDANLDDYGASANFAYTRPIPWGRLYLDLGHLERSTDYQLKLSLAQVRNEPHRLVGGYENRELLGRIDIDIDTVRVTDVDGNEFIRDLDYGLEQDGNRVYIWRMLLGGIEDGQEVLVSYDYKANPSVNLTRSTNLYGTAVDLWSTLRLYYRRIDTDVDVRSGTEPKALVHTSDLVGTEVRWHWGDIASATGFESEDIEAELVSSNILRARQRLTIGSWSSTELEAEEEKANETVEEENGESILAHNRTKTLFARQRFTIGSWSNTDFEAEDRSIEGDVTERTGVPATILRLRQELIYGGWSTTTLEAEDITLKGDPADFPLTRLNNDEILTTNLPGSEEVTKGSFVDFPMTSFHYELTPSTTFRIRQTLAFRLTSTLRAGLGASYFERERKDTDLHSEGGSFSATVNWKLGETGRFGARAFEEQSRSDINSEERLGLDVWHEWIYGAWRPRIRYALSKESWHPTDEMRRDSLLYLEVRRRFW